MVRTVQTRCSTARVALLAGIVLSTMLTVPASAASSPTLGISWNSNGGVGYGTVKPITVSNGGDPTGVVTSITWRSWGGARAIGSGTSDYVAPGKSVAGGTQETVTIVAFDLGTCGGHSAYRGIEWYFPGHGQSFSATTYINACTGTYVVPPARCIKSQLTSVYRTNGLRDFTTIWLACRGNWAVVGGYSPSVGFSVGLLNYVGVWVFTDRPSDGWCMLDFKTTQVCNYNPPPTLPIPYSVFRALVLKAGLQIVEGGTTVTAPAGWKPPTG